MMSMLFSILQANHHHASKNDLVRKVNVEGTRNIINACFRHNVKRLIYTSSIHALKRIPCGKIMDESLPFDPDNPYGAYDSSKAEASIMVQDAANKGLDAVIVCPTGVIGTVRFQNVGAWATNF